MKGRHFPETRPIVKNEETKRHKNRTHHHGSSARKRQPIKRQPTERKIPFAPQVAEERETVARFASFPNGDPNLALLKNGTNNDTTPPLSLKTEPNMETNQKPLVNGQMINNSPINSLNVQDESVLLNSGGNGFKPNLQEAIPKPFPQDFQDHQSAITPVIDNTSLSKSPEIPNRKHRSQTAPFPASPVLNGSGGSESSSARRSQSAVVLANSTQQPDRSKMVIGRPVERSAMPVTNGQSSSSTPRVEHRSATQSMSRVENAVMLPVAARLENQSSAMPARNENPLTMSAASHLVMQSFNAMQGINSNQVDNPGSNLRNSPKNSPSSTPNKILTPKNSPTTTPARTCTPPRHKGSHRGVEESVVYYGKDPFEHYGIAQGAILRDSARRGSMESGNRSVSNWGSMFDFGFAWHRGGGWRMERLSSWRGLRMGRDTVHRVLVWSTVYAPCFWLGGGFGETWYRWGIGDWYYTYWRSLGSNVIALWFILNSGERDILRGWRLYLVLIWNDIFFFSFKLNTISWNGIFENG